MRATKRILVTGGAGFIGSAFIRAVLARTEKIVNLDLLTYAGSEKNLASIGDDPKYLFVKGDICDRAVVYNLCKEHYIDAIVHCAAQTHVDRSIENPSDFIETNIRGTFALLEVVRTLPHIHFHHVSTDEVYGSLAKGYFNELSACRPSSPYSASKAASDHLVCAWAHTYGISATISHCTNNFGPYQFPEKFIPRLILCCLNHAPLPIYGQGHNIRDWLYVDDHAEALWAILQKGRPGQVYDISARCEKSNLDVAHEIMSHFAHMNPSLVYVPDRPGHDFRYALDPTKLETELGWYPKHSFSKALQQTIEWYSNEYSLCHSSKT